MKGYYTRTFFGIAVVFVVLAGAAVLANAVASEARIRYSQLLEADKAGAQLRTAQRQKVERLQRAIEPVREFAAAWTPVARLPEKGAAERVRSDIEAIAQRQLGLVTDNAITPQPERYPFQGLPVRVQRVTLRASGKDLTALMTWLGKVEERYPAALIEGCEFSSNVGGNTGLTIRLVQPLHDNAPRRAFMPATLADPATLPDAIAAIAWSEYLPARLKGPVAVGFHRNPLQPAVQAEHRPMPLVHDDSDEITPRLELALDGRVRSVIRGAVPIVVIDSRVFRVGDDVIVGANRERPIPDSKTKLKEIGDDRLIFHVAGGTVDRPVQCDVTYPLPAFLKAR